MAVRKKNIMKINKTEALAIVHDNGYLALDTISHKVSTSWDIWMEKHATENGCKTKAEALQEGYRSTKILLIWE
jgi:hypothetical protein